MDKITIAKLKWMIEELLLDMPGVQIQDYHLVALPSKGGIALFIPGLANTEYMNKSVLASIPWET